MALLVASSRLSRSRTFFPAMLPCSFRLLGKGHQFELAAACQREKEAWTASMREAKAHRTSWINEPTSSLYLDARGGPIQQSESAEVLQSITPLPTIQSIPELRGSSVPPCGGSCAL